MILHTVNKSPYATDTLRSCLRNASDDDTVILIEDGVYAAMAQGKFAKLLKNTPMTFFALSDDVLARGLDGHLDDSVQTVDYAGFVKLTTHHDKVVSWF